MDYLDATEVIYMRDLLTMRDQVTSAIQYTLEVQSLRDLKLELLYALL